MGWIDKIKSLFSKKEVIKNDWNGGSGMLEHYDSPKPSVPQNRKEEASDLIDKTKQFVEGTVDEVKEQGSALWSEVKKQADKLDESTKPMRDAIQKKASETMDRVEDFIEETYQKALASEEADKMNSIDQDGDGLADKPIDFKNSDSGKTEQFFNKAKDWLDHQDSPQNEEKGVKVIEPVELPKEVTDESKNLN